MRRVDKGFNLHQKALKRQISQFYFVLYTSKYNQN